MENFLSKLEGLIAAHDCVEECNTIELRRHEGAHIDARLFLRDQRGARSPSTGRLLDAMAEMPEVESVKSKKATVSVRLADDYVEALGRELEGGDTSSIAAPANGAPERYLVGFLGPNISKALHLGHLRNIIIGNALAAAFERAGAQSESYSLIGDIGRNVCEAMAGYRMFHAEAGPGRASMKSDHLIGTYYQEYVDRTRETLGALGDESDPCGREHVPAADLADELLLLWRKGEPATKELWALICDMVERGHDDTLGRLGVVVDRRYYESAHVDAGLEIVRRGLAEGILEQLPDGTIIHDTGRDSFRRLVLVRRDGFPTEHGRVIAVFHRVFVEREAGCVHVDWNGAEWEPALTAMKELMGALALIPGKVTHLPMFHGMLTADGEKMSSRNKGPVLIDDILDELHRSPDVIALADSSQGAVGPQVVTDIVLKGFFLCRAVSKPLTYSWSRLMDGVGNPGWMLARAWCRASAGATSAVGAGSDDSAAYRTAVVQSQGFPRELKHAMQDVQLSGLTRFALQFCESYLASAHTGRTDRVAYTVLGAALDSLGIATGKNPRRCIRDARSLAHHGAAAGARSP